MSPEEIYSARIMKARLKQHRTCRDDKDHLAALWEVFQSGYKNGADDEYKATKETLKKQFP